MLREKICNIAGDLRKGAKHADRAGPREMGNSCSRSAVNRGSARWLIEKRSYVEKERSADLNRYRRRRRRCRVDIQVNGPEHIQIRNNGKSRSLIDNPLDFIGPMHSVHRTL